MILPLCYWPLFKLCSKICMIAIVLQLHLIFFPSALLREENIALTMLNFRFLINLHILQCPKGLPFQNAFLPACLHEAKINGKCISRCTIHNHEAL